MKFFRSVLICLAFRQAVATEQKRDLGQSWGPTPDKFKQYAKDFMSDFDSDDDAPPAPATKKLAVKSAQNGKAVASLLHISDKQTANLHVTSKVAQHAAASAASLRSGNMLTGQTAKRMAGKAVKAISRKVKATAAAGIKLGSFRNLAATHAKDATSIQLKSQLAQAMRMQVALRKRLRDVGASERTHLVELLKQFKVAKVGAQRSEMQLRKQIHEEHARREKAEASDKKLMAQLAAAKASAHSTDRTASGNAEHLAVDKLKEELKATKIQAAHQTSRLRDEKVKLIKAMQEESFKRKSTEAMDSKLMAQLAAAKASALSTGRAAAASGDADHMAVSKLQAELKARKIQAAQEASRIQDDESTLRKALQAEIVKRKNAEASDTKLMAQLAAAKASAISTGRAATAMGEADHLAVGKLTDELKTTKRRAAKETKKLRDQLHQLEQASTKFQSQFTNEAKAHQSQVQLRNEMASELTAELGDQKAKAEKAKADASEMAAQLSHQKTQAAASEAATELHYQKEEGELKDQVAAAKASELSARRAAAAVTSQVAAKSDAEREEVRKLRDEFQTESANLKRTQAESKKVQMQANEETSKLRNQLRQLQQAGANSQSQLADVQKAPIEAAAPTKSKAAAPHSTLQMMADFFSKPR